MPYQAQQILYSCPTHFIQALMDAFQEIATLLFR